MSITSPAKRRATTSRSSMLNQPMRQTRSMARISDHNDFSELSSSSRLVEQRQTTTSSTRNPSPRKARASQAAQLDSFDPDSPDISMAACMESPKKGRFDDFEFELETSTEVPARRRRIARQSTTSPSADVGLPRSKTSCTLNRSNTTTNNTLLTSRKENSAAAPTEPARPGASPVKPVAALPRSSRLHGPTPSIRSSSQTAAVAAANSDTKVSIPNRIESSKPLDSDASESKPLASSCDSDHRLLVGTSDIKPDASTMRNPFLDSADPNSLAMLGEPRHSPVKRFQPKTEFIISSPDRPDRKPINLLELKPSPGKAQRGIFRHDRTDDYEDGEDDWDASGSNTVDEIRLVKGPAPKRDEAAVNRNQPSSESDSATSTAERSIPRSTTTMDVKHTLSTETSDALASLEASLARLKAKTQSPPATSDKMKQGEANADSSHKREPGTARPSGMTSISTQISRTKSIMGSDSSFSSRSTAADQSSDSSVFKRPSGRVSALAKSRGANSEMGSSLSSSLASSKSMMSFGAPRLPGLSELGGRPASRPIMTGSRISSLDAASDDSRAEEEAAQKEEEERVAEAERQTELKAAKRKSMSSILSSGMPPPPLHRKEPEAATKASTATRETRTTATRETRTTATRPSSSSSSRLTSSSTPATTSSAEPTEAELAEARKAAKAARRRSLYTYVPTKREDTDGDRSVGNVSTGLVVTSTTGGNASGATTAAPKKQRFLRGLTVLVDVRDQDGEDASACWIDMLKNAGAKVMVRFGERKLTHIIYKSGRPSTLHSYRALDDPKPHV
ncbi:hypothetical protein, partial [Sporisorium scitamineum]